MWRPFKRRRRAEAGATGAEYVGVVAFVAIIVGALFVIDNPVKAQTEDTISSAFCHIGGVFGGVGCTNEQLPGYIPTTCTLGSNSQTWGGSISIVATVGGDTGYTILRIRERQDDGSYETRYVVRTKGQVSGSYEFGPGGGAEVATGDGEPTEAGGGAKVKIGGDIETGQSFEFDNLEDAEQFAEDNKDNFGNIFSVDGDHEPTSTYYQAGGNVTVTGQAGPGKGSVGGSAVLGVETYANGNTKFKMGLTVEAAAKLGIPVPKHMMDLSAQGKLKLTVQADVTFDADGNLTNISGQIVGQAQGSAGVELGPGHGTEGDNQFTLPGLTLEGGAKLTVGFSTNFDDEARAELSDAVGSFVTGGGLSEDHQDAIAEQFTENTQYTATVSTSTSEEWSVGGKVKIIAVTIGGEVHHVQVDENTQAGWYLNPTTGQWEENLACSE